MKSPETIDQKLFSIIMATYNCGAKVEDTLRSIVSQNPELFELIVFDGASTDDTLEYIKKYESSLTVLVSEPDGGTYDAFNKGIERASGKYLYFIGAGDRLQPGVLERVAELLPPEETPALVYGDFYLMKQKIYRSDKFNSGANFATANLCHQAVFYHRAIFEMIGKYEVQYKICADWLLNFRCFLEDRISKQYIPCHIADFEEGGISSVLRNDRAFRKDFPRLVRKRLGVRLYLICKASMHNPHLVSFGYQAGYAVREHLISLAKPCVYGYRYLKKAVIRK